jgi:hypothetical protein
MVAANSSVTFTATPINKWSPLLYWTVNGVRHSETSPVLTLTMNEHKDVKAVFRRNFYVTNTNDEGAGSLRQAVIDLHTNIPNAYQADSIVEPVITFAPSLAGKTITLASPLIVTKILTIEGDGITISGNNTCNIMDVNNSVTIRRVHFKDGYGRAIYNNAGSLTLQSCIFSGTIGGAIWSKGECAVCEVVVQGCTF